MKLSKREATILEFLAQQPFRSAQAAHLWPLFWDDENKRPKAWRTSVSKAMLLLCAKTQTGPQQVKRSSGMGPGRLAVYSIEENANA